MPDCNGHNPGCRLYSGNKQCVELKCTLPAGHPWGAETKYLLFTYEPDNESAIREAERLVRAWNPGVVYESITGKVLP